jgi:hypothetical protein
VLERIHQETGAPIRNFQDIPTVSNEMFSDTTHLNRYYGAALFTQHLVEQYTELLR